MSGDIDIIARAAQLYYAYARAVDEGDLDLLDTLVTDDVRVIRAEGESQGRQGVRQLYAAYRDQGLPLSRHSVTNIQAARRGEGIVHARAYFTASMVDAAGRFTQVFGQYADELAEVDDQLLIRLKRVVVQRAITLATESHPWAGVAIAP